jgi:hypothetical protein
MPAGRPYKPPAISEAWPLTKPPPHTPPRPHARQPVRGQRRAQDARRAAWSTSSPASSGWMRAEATPAGATQRARRGRWWRRPHRSPAAKCRGSNVTCTTAQTRSADETATGGVLLLHHLLRSLAPVTPVMRWVGVRVSSPGGEELDARVVSGRAGEHPEQHSRVSGAAHSTAQHPCTHLALPSSSRHRRAAASASDWMPWKSAGTQSWHPSPSGQQSCAPCAIPVTC